MSSATIENGNRTIAVSFTALLYGVVIDAALHRVHELALTPENVLLVISLALVVQDFFFYHEHMKRVNLQFLKSTLANEHDASLTDEERKKKRIKAEQRKRRKERRIFFFDAVLLGTWYALSLAAHEPLATYLLVLAVFFLSVALWDTFADPPTTLVNLYAWAGSRESWEWLRCTHWPVGLATGIVAAVAAGVLEAPVAAQEHVAAGATALPQAHASSFADWTWKEGVLLAIPLLLFVGWRRFYWLELSRKIYQDLRDDIDLIAPLPVDVEKRIDGLRTHIDLFVDERFVGLQQLISRKS